MSLSLNGTDPLQLSDLYSRPASKVFPPIQNIRNPSKSSYPDNPLMQPNFRQQNHRQATTIPPKQKNAPSCSFTNSPDAFFYTISVDPRCPAAQPASRHSDPGALFRLTFTVYAPVHSLFPVSQLEHMRSSCSVVVMHRGFLQWITLVISSGRSIWVRFASSPPLMMLTVIPGST